MKEFQVIEPLHIFFYNMKEMPGFYESAKQGRFINRKFCKIMCSTSHYSINAGSLKCS